MKVVIATGIYPPEVGGPAYYAQGLERALQALGHEVAVVSYGDLRAKPMGVSHFLYLRKLWPHLKGAQAVIALDTASVAIPAWFACKLRRVPLVIRTGGDFVWEHYLDRTKEFIPLPMFYMEPRRLSFKESLVFALTRFVVRHAVMIFSTEMQRGVWLAPYGLRKEGTHIVRNAIEPPLSPEEPSKKNYLWYVRDIPMKNGPHVRAAFKKAQEAYPDITLEEGNVPKAELLERMRKCYAVILPSLTDISPNYILDAIRCKKPFVMDKYSGFARWLAPYGLIVDPLDEDDIAGAIEKLATPDGYKEACEKVARFSEVRTYEDIARDFIAIIEKL